MNANGTIQKVFCIGWTSTFIQKIIHRPLLWFFRVDVGLTEQLVGATARPSPLPWRAFQTAYRRSLSTTRRLSLVLFHWSKLKSQRNLASANKQLHWCYTMHIIFSISLSLTRTTCRFSLLKGPIKSVHDQI